MISSHEPVPQRKNSESIWLDIENSFKQESALVSCGNSSCERDWLIRRRAMLVSAFPVVIFLEASGVLVSAQDLKDINRLDRLLEEGLRAHGEIFRGVSERLQAQLNRSPGYNKSSPGHQSESTQFHHAFMLKDAHHLFDSSDAQASS
jgi:hypothetical protein